MLDILRSTPETKDIKVIMMTALSSDDQRQRGESLGADKYLVKSQVGIEDVINAVHEVLGDKEVATADTTPTVANQPMGAQPVEGTTPATEAPAPVETPAPAGAPTQAEAPAPVETPVAAENPATTQNSTAAAMEELLNNTPDTNNATWPGNTSQ